eukprot:TRINITY_DN26965_c0_g1_i1.p1 TRINITY_DN26965_c0_g1~~TRINITY_DN26965_c0_g1_i1.p1  ORF type:complete len:125 (-),score=15.45 TRINITY_DN26965_c0_g1_i1:105-452(-)
MANLAKLSAEYVAAFDAADVAASASFFAEYFVLTDPGGSYEGKEAATAAVKGIFASVNNDKSKISFQARNIFVDAAQNVSVIEFRFRLGDKNLQGTDVIHWNADGKMTAMRAYVY